MAPRPIIIDTDPGKDDAVAILLALASPELEVVGITTVAGNVGLEHTTRNALKLLELARRPEVPVVAGCAQPLVRPWAGHKSSHGRTGMDGAGLPEPTLEARPGHAVDWLVETLVAAPEPGLTLCPIGPLTNVAAALIKEPGIAAHIREIVLMGGGFFEGGNTTPAAEFNIVYDPHAAQVVFSSGVKLTVMPLDVTHQALMTRDWLQALRAGGSRAGAVVAAMMDVPERLNREAYGQTAGPLHDPCTIAWLLHPEWFGGRDCNVTIETGSELTMGMTVVDWWGLTKRPANARWIRTIQAEPFFALIAKRLAALN